MRILFIDPLGDRESTGLNIGIGYCARSVTDKGHVAGVLDLLNIRTPEPLRWIRRAVRSFRPDVVGMSVLNMSFRNTRSYAKDIRNYFGGAIVLGGPEI